jgi:hypothetical protein
MVRESQLLPPSKLWTISIGLYTLSEKGCGDPASEVSVVVTELLDVDLVQGCDVLDSLANSMATKADS